MEFNNYNNNRQNNNYDKSKESETVYSPYRFSNVESPVDQTALTFSYWKDFLCIKIAPRKNTGNDEIAFDYDNALATHLNHSKARILKQELENFLRDPETYNGCGVNSGQSVITINNGRDFGVNSPVLCIYKIDANGVIVSSFAYQFKSDYYFSIRNYTKDGSYNKVTDDYKNTEIEGLIMLLDQYSKAMTGATAYSVIDRFKTSRTNRDNNSKLDAIMKAVGAEMGNGNRGTAKRNYGGSVFNNAPSGMNGPSNSSYMPAGTLDDLD